MSEFTMKRRTFLAAGAAGGIASLFPSWASSASRDLVWSTWESNGNPDYVIPFEQAEDIKIKMSYLTSDDAQFAGLQTGAAADIDVVNPSINGVERYIKAGVLKPLDLSRVPSRANMYPEFATSQRIMGADGSTYALPYLWGLNPIIYRTDKFDKEPDYATLFDSKYAGQLAMRDYALEALAIAGLFVGVPRDEVFTMSTQQLAEAKKALVLQKPLLRTYWQSIGDLTNQFANDEVSCAFSWRVPYDALKDKLPMGMAKPAAGVMGWCDCIALPASLSAEKEAAAYDFINYVLGKDYAFKAARGGNYATSTSVIRDQLSPTEQATIFIDDLSIMKNFLWPVAPANYDEWLTIWNDVKAA